MDLINCYKDILYSVIYMYILWIDRFSVRINYIIFLEDKRVDENKLVRECSCKTCF